MHGVDLCLFDLDESYVRTEIDGVRLLAAGTGGRHLHDTGQRDLAVTAVSGAGYYAIGVEGETLTLEALDRAGRRVDSFTMQDNKGTNDSVETE